MSDGKEVNYESPTVPPQALFVECTDPLRLFPSVDVAENALERMGLESGDCSRAYGPKGEMFHIRMENGRVRIEPSGEPARPDELKNLLLHYFECCEDPWDPTDELNCLVQEAWSIERDYWLRSSSDDDPRRIPAWALVPLAILLGIIVYIAFRR